ncbi:MAG TPA: hypothetical protein VMT79_17550 [Candidatus Binatia bacterium]|nr:hypothetical protein [Candidatus Binatia bacterium]
MRARADDHRRVVPRAVLVKRQHERLRAVLAEMDAEFGPIPAEELLRARGAWPGPGVVRRKPRRGA